MSLLKLFILGIVVLDARRLDSARPIRSAEEPASEPSVASTRTPPLQAAFAATGPSSTPRAFSTFLDAVEAGQIEKVSLASNGKQVLSIDKDGNRHETLLLPGESANLIKLLTSKNVVFAVQAPPEPVASTSPSMQPPTPRRAAAAEEMVLQSWEIRLQRRWEDASAAAAEKEDAAEADTPVAEAAPAPKAASPAAKATALPAKTPVWERGQLSWVLSPGEEFSAEAKRLEEEATELEAVAEATQQLANQQRAQATERRQEAKAAEKAFNTARAEGKNHAEAEAAAKAPLGRTRRSTGGWIFSPGEEFSAEAKRLEEEAIELEVLAKETQQLANYPKDRADRAALTRFSRWEMAKQQRAQAAERRQEAKAAEIAFNTARAEGKNHAEAEVAAKAACKEEKTSKSTAEEASEEEQKDVEASRQRLADLLEKHHMRERPVEMDGNCQFRALADQLYESEEHHVAIRKRVVAQLRSFPERYAEFVPGEFDDYLADMERDCTWGDNVTLQAAADAFGLKINMLTDCFSELCSSDYLTENFIEVIPVQQKSSKVLTLTFWPEVHYNSIERF